MKKALAVFIVVVLLGGLWWSGYNTTHSIWFGFLWIPAAVIFGSIGGLLGMFLLNAFKK